MLRPERAFMLFGMAAAERSWRGLRLLCLVYFGSLIFAALLAPWVYHAMVWWFEVSPNSLNSYLAYKGFEDYFDRLRWIPVVLALPWVLAKCRLWSLRRLGMGLETPQRKRMRKWFYIGCLLMGTVAFAQLQFSPASLRVELSLGSIIGILLKALVGGLLLGLLEETVFRGLILRLFYTAGGPIVALLLGSLFFAYVHFKMPDRMWNDAFPPEITPAEAQVYALEHGKPPPLDLKRVNAWSGFYVAWGTIIGITQDFQWVKFLNLFALGCVLSLLTLRSRSLMPAIGMHAGLVFIMLSYRKLAVIPERSLFLGGDGIVDGLFPLCLLTLLSILLVVLPASAPSGNDY